MNEAFMRAAIRLSIKGVVEGSGGPFGAVIVRDGRIIASGSNGVTIANDPTAHAEIVAIREACRSLGTFQLAGCEIYSSCEPCPMCLGAIYWARLDRAFYANTRADAARIAFDDDFLYRELSLPIESRRLPLSQLLRDEALEAFRLWEAKTDKVRY